MKIIIYYWFLVLVGGKILLPKWNLAGKNGYLAEKNGNLAEKNGNPAGKNGYRVEKSCYFPSFYMTSVRKLYTTPAWSSYKPLDKIWKRLKFWSFFDKTDFPNDYKLFQDSGDWWPVHAQD